MKKRMYDFIDKYYRLNRVKISNESNQFLKDLNAIISGRLITAKTGEECLTWYIPYQWEVNEAYIEDERGKRVADFAWHPLYLKTYSAPFRGIVDKSELLNHIRCDENKPDSLIYEPRQQYRALVYPDWGFSLPFNVAKNLQDCDYKVHIDVEFLKGEMLVIDKTIIGSSDETIFFAAHTCHPALVNDGIACIAVLIELLKWIESLPERKYNYRFIFGPEYYAAIMLLTKGENVENLKGGFFLDMAGNNEKIGFAHSYNQNSIVDYFIKEALTECNPGFIEKPYRQLWGNDEIFYDGPDFLIPTIGLGRDRFINYHTDKDNLDNCNMDQLEETFNILKRTVCMLESDKVYRRLYKGALYLDRYNLKFDSQKDPDLYRAVQEIQIWMDGKKSLREIARLANITYGTVLAFVKKLEELNLIEEVGVKDE